MESIEATVKAENVAPSAEAPTDAMVEAVKLIEADVAADNGSSTDEPAVEAEAAEVEPAEEAKTDKTPSDVVKSYKGLKRMQRKLEAERAEFEKNRSEAKAQLQAELARLTDIQKVADRLEEIRKDPKKVMQLLQEAGVTYEDMTRWKLDELNGTAHAEDPRVDRLEAELKAFREQQQKTQEEQSTLAQRQREHAFIGAAESYSELKTFLDNVPNAKTELLTSAYEIGRQMAAGLGRPPTDKELLDKLEENAAAYHRSLFEKLAPKFVDNAGLVSAATPAKTRGAPPKAISNSHGGASVRDMSTKTQAEREAEAERMLRAMFAQSA